MLSRRKKREEALHAVEMSHKREHTHERITKPRDKKNIYIYVIDKDKTDWLSWFCCGMRWKENYFFFSYFSCAETLDRCGEGVTWDLREGGKEGSKVGDCKGEEGGRMQKGSKAEGGKWNVVEWRENFSLSFLFSVFSDFFSSYPFTLHCFL